MTDESKISKRYRELAREEPPRALDDAILAKSRRAITEGRTHARPAPLVVPTGRRRWYFPLAAAAIIVLAVAVTVHVERQQSDAEIAMQTQGEPTPPADKGARLAERSPASEVARDAQVAPERKAPPSQPGDKREQYAADPKPAPPPPPASARESEVRARDATDALASRRDEASQPQARSAPAPARQGGGTRSMQAAMPAPEQWLQGIADLRRQGRHEEADKALAEFRRAYPEYKISEAMLEKVEKR